MHREGSDIYLQKKRQVSTTIRERQREEKKYRKNFFYYRIFPEDQHPEGLMSLYKSMILFVG